MALYYLTRRQARSLLSHLDCPVESCFKVLVQKGWVCPLLQQHLGVLRSVVESCPVEWSHPLRVLMVDLTEAGLLQQDYEEPVGKDRVDQRSGQPWVLGQHGY